MNSTRDFADKTGAFFGTLAGATLAGYLYAQGNAGNLVINGQQYEVDPPIQAAIAFLTVGLCSNLSRNAFVGLHDTGKFTMQAIKGASQAIVRIMNRCLGDQPGNPEMEMV